MLNDSQFIIHSKVIRKNFTENIGLFISHDLKFNEKRFQEIGNNIMNSQTIIFDNLLLNRCNEKTLIIQQKFVEYKEFYKHLYDNIKIPEYIELRSRFLNDIKIETKENRQKTLNLMNEVNVNLVRNYDKFINLGIKDIEMNNILKLHDELTNVIHLMDLYCRSIKECEQKTISEIYKLKENVAEIKQAALKIYETDKEAILKFFIKKSNDNQENYRKYIEMKETHIALECVFDETVYLLFENEGKGKLKFGTCVNGQLQKNESFIILEPDTFKILKADEILRTSEKIYVCNDEDIEGLYRITLLF